MKLYLASYAKVTLNKILANESIDFSGKKAVFVPTAGDPYDNKDFVEADRDALIEAGMDVMDLDFKNIDAESIKKILSDAALVLVAGGDTFYLMDKINKSRVQNVIKEYVANGGIYIGSSAGSIICCPTIEGAAEFDDPDLAPDLKNFDGLGIFNNIIIPHAHKEKYFERIKRATESLEKKGFQVYPLTDDEVLFYDGSLIEIL